MDNKNSTTSTKTPSFKDKLTSLFKGDKKVKLLVIIGIIGMVLILLSEFFNFNNKNNIPNASNSDQQQDYLLNENNKYIQNTQQRIKTLISGIEGVGNCEVMITVENGVEYIYATEEKIKTETKQDSSGSKKEERKETDNQYVIIDKSGNKSALIKTLLEPKIKGIVIVCEGGENITVKKKIIEAVTTAFDISSTRVYVTY